MRSLAAACALGLLLPACSGGSASPTPSGVVPVVGVPDPQARSLAQSALLAQQAAIVLVRVSGGPSLLDLRRTASARAKRTNVACSGGFSEQDTPTAHGAHVVISLYNDAACTLRRQTAALDWSVGVDTGTMTGTITSFDAAGNVAVVQGLDESTFASLGGLTWRSTDTVPPATPSGAQTLLGRTTVFCSFLTPGCALATVADGLSFETGVTLGATTFAQIVAPGANVTVTFAGSVSTGAVGSMTITQQPGQPPVLAGASPPVAFSGSLTIAPGPNGPAAFSLALDTVPASGGASSHVAATFFNGTTTIAVSGGASAVVNLNGDGTVSYPSGATGKILDYHIAS